MSKYRVPLTPSFFNSPKCRFLVIMMILSQRFGGAGRNYCREVQGGTLGKTGCRQKEPLGAAGWATPRGVGRGIPLPDTTDNHAGILCPTAGVAQAPQRTTSRWHSEVKGREWAAWRVARLIGWHGVFNACLGTPRPPVGPFWRPQSGRSPEAALGRDAICGRTPKRSDFLWRYSP